MKILAVTAIAAAAVVSAKSDQRYSTSVYTECTNLPDTTLTSYNTETITYCSECQGGVTTLHGKYAHTTIWTTTLVNFCPTGLSETTVTITESCNNATPTWSPGHSNYVPQGYTTSLMTCSVCGAKPITRVMTYPSASPPSYPPAGAGAPTQAPADVSSCPGPECKVPYPTAPPAPVPGSQGGPAGAGCTGAGCSVPSPAPNTIAPPQGNTSSIMPSLGAASFVSSQLSSVAAVLVAAVVAFVAF